QPWDAGHLFGRKQGPRRRKKSGKAAPRGHGRISRAFQARVICTHSPPGRCNTSSSRFGVRCHPESVLFLDAVDGFVRQRRKALRSHTPAMLGFESYFPCQFPFALESLSSGSHSGRRPVLLRCPPLKSGRVGLANSSPRTFSLDSKQTRRPPGTPQPLLPTRITLQTLS